MRIKKEMQRTAGRQSAPHDSRAASLSGISIAQSDAGVNIHDTQNGKKYALDLKAPIETEQSSPYDDSKPFREQVEDFLEGKIPERDTLLISGTPEVLQKIGFSNLPLTIDQKHMRDVLGKPKNADHDLGVDFMKHLDEYVAHPIAIIENSGDLDGGVIMIFSEKNKNANDKPIIGMMNIRNKGRFNIAETDANRLMTIHSRGDWMKRLQEAIQKEQNGQVGIYYINKKEAVALFENGQSQVLSRNVQDGFNHSITEEALPVNMKRMGWHDDFELNGVRGRREGSGRHRTIFAQKKETPTESALTVRASNLFSDGRVQFPAMSEQAVLTLSIFDAGGDVKENDELGAFDALRFGCKPVSIAKCFTTCGEREGH